MLKKLTVVILTICAFLFAGKLISSPSTFLMLLGLALAVSPVYTYYVFYIKPAIEEYRIKKLLEKYND